MTDDDQVLSRLAAKAIGLDLGEYRSGLSSMPDDYLDGFMVGEVGPLGFRGYYWNPLEHDGDALRLALALRLDVEFDGPRGVRVKYDGPEGVPYMVDEYLSSKDAASDLRRAIVRAAAEIGQSSCRVNSLVAHYPHIAVLPLQTSPAIESGFFVSLFWRPHPSGLRQAAAIRPFLFITACN